MTYPHSRHAPGGSTLDEQFEALSGTPRRHILTILAKANPREDGAAFVPSDFTSDERRDDITRLHHVHLPKLDEAGFIDWDPDLQKITRGPRFDEIAPLIELMIAHQDELPAGWP